MDEEQSTNAGLAQENSFSPARFLSLLRLVKSAPTTEECNKYDLTAAPCFGLTNQS
jgi:hypothetical protein